MTMRIGDKVMNEMTTCANLRYVASTVATSSSTVCVRNLRPMRSHTHSIGERSGEAAGQKGVCISPAPLRGRLAMCGRTLSCWTIYTDCTNDRNTAKTTWLTYRFTMCIRTVCCPKAMLLEIIMPVIGGTWHSRITAVKWHRHDIRQNHPKRNLSVVNILCHSLIQLLLRRH